MKLETEKQLEEAIVEFRIRLNKRLYDNKIISLETYHDMEKFLITKLKKSIRT